MNLLEREYVFENENNQNSIRKYFSESENYAIESIPEKSGYFERKNWISKKLSDIGSEKALVFTEKSKIMWAFLNEDEKYWLPVEKIQFYLSVFEKKSGSFLIVEEKFGQNKYYGVVDNFMVVYTKDFEEAVYSIRKHNKNKDFVTLGVGNVEKCDHQMTHQQIASKIGIKDIKESKSIDDDMIFVREDSEFYEGYEKVEKSIINPDDTFYFWFENIRNKVSAKRGNFVKYMLFAIMLFSFADAYMIFSKSSTQKEITQIVLKISEINKSMNKIDQ